MGEADTESSVAMKVISSIRCNNSVFRYLKVKRLHHPAGPEVSSPGRGRGSEGDAGGRVPLMKSWATSY